MGKKKGRDIGRKTENKIITWQTEKFESRVNRNSLYCSYNFSISTNFFKVSEKNNRICVSIIGSFRKT